jgi:alpha-galactosidase
MTDAEMPASVILRRFPKSESNGAAILDPTHPDVLELIREDCRTIASWGFELLKFDFTTYDLMRRWGFQMGWEPAPDGWSFHDRSKTTAEAVLGLYRAIREGSGDMLLIGCNTIGHLAAGIVEIQRTGDDTSGRQWERTRKMGVNTLAFRMPQHDAFFAVDADCAGITRDIPWTLNSRWLDLLAKSGTPLFVSAAPDAMTPEVRAALQAALAAAARPQPVAEPLDWLETTCPSSWRFEDGDRAYDWSEPDGIDLSV